MRSQLNKYKHIFRYKNDLIGIDDEKSLFYIETTKVFHDLRLERDLQLVEENLGFLPYFSYVNKSKAYFWHFQSDEFYLLNDGIIKIFDCDEYQPYSIAEFGEFLFIAYPTLNSVSILKLVSNKYKVIRKITLSYPESLFLYDDKIYVSEMGNKKIVTIDRDFNISNFKEVGFAPFNYIRDKNYEYFLDGNGSISKYTITK